MRRLEAASHADPDHAPRPLAAGLQAAVVDEGGGTREGGDLAGHALVKAIDDEAPGGATRLRPPVLFTEG